MTRPIAEAVASSEAAGALDWAGGRAETLLLRINPVAGRRLGTAELRLALQRLVEAQRRKGLLREAACDDLYAMTAGLEGKQRNVALTLKRAIFNDRDPGPGTGSLAWPPTVAAWLAQQQIAMEAETEIRSSYGELLAAERSALTDALGDEAFNLGLALLAPQAFDAVQRYRHASTGLSARLRKSERGLVQYLTRAMLRTSPLSWFTAVGFGIWSPGGTPLDQPAFDRAAARSFVSVDRVLLGGAVTGMVPPEPGTVPTLLSRNPSLRAGDATARFQRRNGDEVALVETPLTPQLLALLQLTALGPLPASVLAEQLADRLRIEAETGAQIVRAATTAQILVSGPLVDEQVPDLLGEARAILGREHPGSALLAAVQREVEEVETRSVSRRRAALGRLEIVKDRINAVTTRPARIQLNEDVMLPVAAISDRGYQAALHDLASVAELASLFDGHLVIRELLTAAFVERFGAGGSANLVDVADELVRDVTEKGQLLSRTGGGHGVTVDAAGTAATQLLSMRGQVRARLSHVIKAAGNNEELWLPSQALAELAQLTPDWLRSNPASYALLVQPVEGRLVLGGCYAGNGILGVRFLGNGARLASMSASGDSDWLGASTVGAHQSDRLCRLFGGAGIRLVEDYGMHGSNLDHRVRQLDVIDPQQWLDVRLVHDTGSGQRANLRLETAAGTPLRVLYLGLRWIETLPPPLRIAMWLTSTSQVAFDPISWARGAAIRAGDETPDAATVRYPRVVAGAVVVGRRRWYPGPDFPGTQGGADDPGYLLAMTRWRARHHVPEEIVVKSAPATDLGVDPSGTVAWYRRTRRRGKPQYVDLSSALMVRVLQRLLERRASGYLEEALPGVRDGAHAFEWVVEYDRPAGGTFRAGPALSADGRRAEKDEAWTRL